MLAAGVAIPTVIVEGTPTDVDRYLVSALWKTDGAGPSVADVIAWRRCLYERGEDFASHKAACYYWLCEHLPEYPPLLPMHRSSIADHK